MKFISSLFNLLILVASAWLTAGHAAQYSLNQLLVETASQPAGFPYLDESSRSAQTNASANETPPSIEFEPQPLELWSVDAAAIFLLLCLGAFRHLVRGEGQQPTHLSLRNFQFRFIHSRR
ncbi:hypothetical protein [Vibrio stylophorae]|uniref:hypothetical protein n=1 Tax=Vibrio stylophorae TaxID=659351 RepID=UPI001F1ADB5D|nr:hypothetical protein [Vibrio stylophorae]